MGIIRAKHYGETENALMDDPIIKKMASNLVMDCKIYGMKFLDQYTHEDGFPNMKFMNLALREYQNRGGKIECHIGGPANAILAIVRKSND